MAGQGSQISDHKTHEPTGPATLHPQNAVYRASIPRTRHSIYVSRDYVSQEPRSARQINTTSKILDSDANYAENYTYISPGFERMTRGIDTLTLSAKLESGNTNIPEAGCVSNTNTKITRKDKFTLVCSMKDRLSSEEGTSSLNHPTQNDEANLDIKVLDQAAHQKSCYLGVGSWISDNDVNGIKTHISSIGESDEASQESCVLLNCIANSIRSAAGEASRTNQTPRQSSNAGATAGHASHRGGLDGKQKPPAKRKGNKDLEGDSEEDQKGKPNQSRKRKYAGTGERKFACPIFKQDPGFHKENPGHFRICRGPGWVDIPRLKEHIYRKHHASVRCGRCQKIFGEQKDLDSHQQEDDECEKQPTTLPKGWITTAQERELRKRHPGQSDLENWNSIFAILFPNDVCPSSPYYHDDNVSSFQDFALEHMPLHLETNLGPVINKYPLDGPQKMSLTNEVKEVVTFSQKQIMDDYNQGNGNATVSQSMSETGKEFDSMESGHLPAVPNYLPLSNARSWSPSFYYPAGPRTSLPSMTEGSGTLYSSSPGPGPQTPNNPTMSWFSNSRTLGRLSASSSTTIWSAQPSPQVFPETHDTFVDGNADPSVHSVGKLRMFPRTSVSPHGSPIPAADTRGQRTYRNNSLRTRKVTTPTQLSPPPGRETGQRVLNQPQQSQFSSNIYGQASKEPFNENHVMISPSSQTTYAPAPQNTQSQTQFSGNNYNQVPGEQYDPPTNPPPSAMGHMMPTPQNASLQTSFSGNPFFSDPNYSPYHYHPTDPR